MKFTPEQKLLLSCNRQNFTEAHQQIVENLSRTREIDWELIFRTAQLHGVACLIYTNLQRSSISIPAEIEAKFRQITFTNILNKEKLAQNIALALDYFEKKSIKVMLIKGAALDVLVYKQPFYMNLLDADLIINVKRDEISETEWKENRWFLHKTGLEYDYFVHHDVIMNGALPVDFERIWKDAQQVEFRGRKLLVMSPEDLLITGCINSCRKRYFRLKSLCDLAETINHYPDLDWAKLADKAKAYRCHLIVYTALFVASQTVGCDLPDNLRKTLGVGRLRAKAIHDLVQRSSLTAYDALFASKAVLNRKLDHTLALSYATFQWSQIWSRLKFVWFYSTGEKRRKFVWRNGKLQIDTAQTIKGTKS